MVKTYGHHPSQLRVDGRTVVSTFGGERGIAWKKDILAPLKAAGYDVFLVPFFYPRPRVTELPDEATVREHYRKWADLVDGMFFFGGAGTAPQLAASNAAYAKVLREAGKVSHVQLHSRCTGAASSPTAATYETCGGEGIETAMEVDHRAPARLGGDRHLERLQRELHLSGRRSITGAARSVPSYLKSRSSHAGYLELSRYYIEWYKTGRQPPLKDALFWFYRVHPKDAVAAEDRPVRAFHGEVADVLYVTAMMTAPAELHVTSGGTTSVHPLAAGIQHLRIPFSCGAQHFAVYRGGKEMIAGDGEPIADRIERYDFFPTSGFAYAP